MRRFLFVLPLLVGPLAGSAIMVCAIAACGSTSAADRGPTDPEDASMRRDGGLVTPPEGGAYDAGSPLGPKPECGPYCDLVMAACTGRLAQYETRTECIALCARLPSGDAGDKASDTVACRQYYAGSPAKTNPASYCHAAGPFGGGVCGDRCPVFCGLALDACTPAANGAPYASYPDCQTACAGFAYKDGGTDGGGESPDGPATGDTLNCRLFHVRGAVRDGSGCANIGADSGACR